MFSNFSNVQLLFFLPLKLTCNLWGDTLRAWRYPAPHQNFPLDLTSINDSWLTQFLSLPLQNNDFPTPVSPSHLPVSPQNSTVSKGSPTPSYIHSFIYLLWLWTHEFLFYQWFIMALIYFDAQIVLDLASRSRVKLVPILYELSNQFFSLFFLISDITRCSRLIL